MTKQNGWDSLVDPYKKIGQITLDNVMNYKAKFLPARTMPDHDFMELARRILPY